jgi:hypothetical protein
MMLASSNVQPVKLMICARLQAQDVCAWESVWGDDRAMQMQRSRRGPFGSGAWQTLGSLLLCRHIPCRDIAAASLQYYKRSSTLLLLWTLLLYMCCCFI